MQTLRPAGTTNSLHPKPDTAPRPSLPQHSISILMSKPFSLESQGYKWHLCVMQILAAWNWVPSPTFPISFTNYTTLKDHRHLFSKRQRHLGEK